VVVAFSCPSMSGLAGGMSGPRLHQVPDGMLLLTDVRCGVCRALNSPHAFRLNRSSSAASSWIPGRRTVFKRTQHQPIRGKPSAGSCRPAYSWRSRSPATSLLLGIDPPRSKFACSLARRRAGRGRGRCTGIAPRRAASPPRSHRRLERSVVKGLSRRIMQPMKKPAAFSSVKWAPMATPGWPGLTFWPVQKEGQGQCFLQVAEVGPLVSSLQGPLPKTKEKKTQKPARLPRGPPRRDSQVPFWRFVVWWFPFLAV